MAGYRAGSADGCHLRLSNRLCLRRSSRPFLPVAANLQPRIARRSFFFPASIIIVLLASVSSWQEGLRLEDWRDSITKEPGPFTRFRATNARYEFGWSGVTAADANIAFGQNADGDFAIDLTAKTTGIARALWKMDASGTSVCKAATLQPVKVTQTEIYKKKTITTTVDFTAEGASQLRVLTPPESDSPQVKKFNFTPMHDMFSALLFIRSRPLTNGESVKLCVYPASAAYFAVATVVGREKIKVAQKNRDSIKCELRLNEVESSLVLRPHAKFKKAHAWISDDSDRLLLKVEAEVLVGNVWAELRSVEFSEEK